MQITLSEKIKYYIDLSRLNRPIGIFLLLWPTLWAVWIASDGKPAVSIVVIFVLGTILTRSGGCILNDMADRDFDGHVERTKNRPLVTKKVSLKEAALLAAGYFCLAFLLIIGLSRLTILLAFVAVFLAASYPLMKRWISLPQAYLGLAFGFGVPMAFAAVRDALPLEAWLLFVASCFWTLAYDTEYAMADRKDDLKINIRTSAITFGRFDTLAIVASYAMMQTCLIVAGIYVGMGVIYYAGIGIATGFMGYHYFLIQKRNPQQCFKAFRHNNWVGLVIFAAIVIDYAYRGAMI